MTIYPNTNEIRIGTVLAIVSDPAAVVARGYHDHVEFHDNSRDAADVLDLRSGQLEIEFSGNRKFVAARSDASEYAAPLTASGMKIEYWKIIK